MNQRGRIIVIAATALIAGLTALSVTGFWADTLQSGTSAADGMATPIPTPASSSPPVVQFGPSGTQVEFDALLGDMNVNVIEMAGGTYRGWHLRFAHHRAARPLLVRPAPGAAVVWDDTDGTSGDALFYVGWGPGYLPAANVTDYITFDPAGTGGSFTIQNYALGQQGLVSTGWVDHVAFNGFHTRGITGVAPGWLSWEVYVSSDGVNRGSNVTFNDWDVAASADRYVGGLHTFHNPQARNVTALRWRIDGAKSAITLYGDVTGLDVEGWTITNCEYAVTSDGTAAGILRNNEATGSTSPPIIREPLIDGGGNAWH